MNALLEVEGLEVSFGSRHKPFRAVNGVSFSVAEGETVGLVGESGSGKSTIGRSILGLVAPSDGTLRYAEQDLVEGWQHRRRDLAKEIQVVFQDPNSSLNPLMTVGQVLEEPLLTAARMPKRQARARVREMLNAVGLPAGAESRYSAEFSGGQRQRVAIARALVVEPKLVVCDEPVSALDLSTQAQVINLLSRLKDETGVAYLFISHDLSVVRHLADRTVVLYRGQVMETGPAEAVADSPLHPYTVALAAASPLLDVDEQRAQRERRRESITLNPGIPIDHNGCPFASRCPFMADVCLTDRPRITVQQSTSVACHMYDPASGHPKAKAVSGAAA